MNIVALSMLYFTLASSAKNRLWSIGEASSTQSQLMLQIEHTDGSDSTSPHIMPVQLASLNQKSINTSMRQPVIIELPKRMSAMPRKRPSSDLDVPQIGTTTNMFQSYTTSQVPHVQPSRHLSSQPLTLTAVENVQQSNSKPSLILSPQHCAQIKYYANLYAVRDVKKWIDRNCAFAKMYLPNATCEEINLLVDSCNL
uniref:Secreted protein n=1 Tax=Ascaris lumbricoides TaxID=6252 RepID=A0A0M3IG50_ASCLU